jgi:uncharacterized membrane protein
MAGDGAQHVSDRGETRARLPSKRLDSVDLVRGLVMVIMALDHVKGNFAHLPFDPIDLSKTTPGFFLTRWITHFCAPTFVFLAGTGAFLYRARGRSSAEVSWFLLSRGLWLVFLEVTVVRFSWFANVNYGFTIGQVIWAIGWSMVAMSALVYLPTWLVTLFGVAMMASHNLMDAWSADDLRIPQWAWAILHTGDFIKVTEQSVFLPMYPLIPWIGVMAAGYGLGAIMVLDRPLRRKTLFVLGLTMMLAFVGLRYVNLYGDFRNPRQPFAGPWSMHDDGAYTLFSFLNCQKYPPSLLFLLMTLGPAITCLAIFDYQVGPLGKFFVVFGRVPLFYYLIHWFCLKGLAIALALQRYGNAAWMYDQTVTPPEDYGYSLGTVYLIWVCLVLALWPPCYWFSEVKRRSSAWWLSYL